MRNFLFLALGAIVVLAAVLAMIPAEAQAQDPRVYFGIQIPNGPSFSIGSGGGYYGGGRCYDNRRRHHGRHPYGQPQGSRYNRQGRSWTYRENGWCVYCEQKLPAYNPRCWRRPCW